MNSMTFRRSIALLSLILAAGLLLAACSKPRQPPLPVGSLKLGVADFMQPITASDMLAGYAPEDAAQVDKKVLNEADALFATVLAEKSKNTFRGKASSQHCTQTVRDQGGRSNNQAALRYWSAVGRCMGVDLLVVPHLYEWRERDGSAIGAAAPAKVVMDIYVLDVRNEALISRSHFDETQSALSSNLLEADKFFKRGGKWITAHDLAREGMEKAIKELGL